MVVISDDPKSSLLTSEAIDDDDAPEVGLAIRLFTYLHIGACVSKGYASPSHTGGSRSCSVHCRPQQHPGKREVVPMD
jgi:hypothetical protein